MTKKVIIIASDAGNIGKTLIASAILETLRRHVNVDAYVCDSHFQGLYKRYGEKDKKTGNLIDLGRQNATNGVAFLDISDPSQKQTFGDKLEGETEYMLFDLPANATNALATCMGRPEDFLEFMDFADSKPIFVCPIKDEKSVTSFRSLKGHFPEAEFILVFNWGAVKAAGPNPIADKFMSSTYEELKDYKHIILDETLSETIFQNLEDSTFREVYVPRKERTVDGVVTGNESDFKCQKKTDQFVLNRFIPKITKEIEDLFLN